MIDRLEKWMKNWRWASALCPVWAVVGLIRTSLVVFDPGLYIDNVAYTVLFALAPWWIWAGTEFLVNAMVLWRKTRQWQLLQGIVYGTQGIGIFLTSIGSESSSPIIGLVYTGIAIALWLDMIRSYNYAEEIKRRTDASCDCCRDQPY